MRTSHSTNAGISGAMGSGPELPQNKPSAIWPGWVFVGSAVAGQQRFRLALPTKIAEISPWGVLLMQVVFLWGKVKRGAPRPMAWEIEGVDTPWDRELLQKQVSPEGVADLAGVAIQRSDQ